MKIQLWSFELTVFRLLCRNVAVALQWLCAQGLSLQLLSAPRYDVALLRWSVKEEEADKGRKWKVYHEMRNWTDGMSL